MAAVILAVSAGLLGFYLQIVCRKILRRRSAQQYYPAIVRANSLEFPCVRSAVEGCGVFESYSRMTATLKCDYMALTYLLKYATNVHQRATWEERLLMLYFRMLWVSLAARHWLRWREKSAVLRLTEVLQYFANVVGERVERARFDPWSTNRVAD